MFWWEAAPFDPVAAFVAFMLLAFLGLMLLGLIAALKTTYQHWRAHMTPTSVARHNGRSPRPSAAQPAPSRAGAGAPDFIDKMIDRDFTMLKLIHEISALSGLSEEEVIERVDKTCLGSGKNHIRVLKDLKNRLMRGERLNQKAPTGAPRHLDESRSSDD